MAENWYLAVRGRGYGPFSTDQIHQLTEAGALDPANLVWQEGDLESSSVSHLNHPRTNQQASQPLRDQSFETPEFWWLGGAVGILTTFAVAFGLALFSNPPSQSISEQSPSPVLSDDGAKPPGDLELSPPEIPDHSLANQEAAEELPNIPPIGQQHPGNGNPANTLPPAKPPAPPVVEQEPAKKTTAEVKRFLYANKQKTHPICVEFLPSGQTIVAGGKDSVIRAWEVESGQETWTWSGLGDKVLTLRFSPDGQRLFVSSTRRVAILDAGTGRLLEDFPLTEAEVVVFSPDCTLLAAFREDQKGIVFNIKSRKVVQQVTSPSVVTCAAFSPNSSELMLGWARLHKLNLRNGNFTKTFITPSSWSYINGLCYSPDGSQVAGGSHKTWSGQQGTQMGDRMVRIWDAKSGRLKHELSGHREWVNSVVFSPDGTRLLTGGGGNPDDWGGFRPGCDNSVRVWEASSGELLETFEGHQGSVLALSVSRDNQFAVSASCDGSLILWRLPHHP